MLFQTVRYPLLAKMHEIAFDEVIMIRGERYTVSIIADSRVSGVFDALDLLTVSDQRLFLRSESEWFCYYS